MGERQIDTDTNRQRQREKQIERAKEGCHRIA